MLGGSLSKEKVYKPCILAEGTGTQESPSYMSPSLRGLFRRIPLCTLVYQFKHRFRSRRSQYEAIRKLSLRTHHLIDSQLQLVCKDIAQILTSEWQTPLLVIRIQKRQLGRFSLQVFVFPVQTKKSHLQCNYYLCSRNLLQV